MKIVVSYKNYILKLLHKLKFNNYYFVILFFALAACNFHSNKQLNTSFYVWQNQINWTSKKSAYLKATQAKNLYIKYIELLNDEIISTKINPIPNINIVPVIRIDNVFLSNNVLSNAEKCEKIYSLVNTIHVQNFNKNIQTIQIDCDYSNANKSNYQQLISSLKTNYHLQVQITLNLYRITKTEDLPIADKYFIMLYDYQQKDEIKIFDEKAMNFFKKPLMKFNRPFAYALPIFDRCIIKSKNNYVFNYSIQIEEIKNNNAFSFIGNESFLVIKDCVINDQFFSKNSKVIFQESTLQNLENYKNYIRKIHNTHADEIAFFSLNESTIYHFPYNKIIELK